MPTPPTDPIVARLRALAETAPDLQEAARVYEMILPCLRDADLRVEPLALTPDAARQKLDAGLPLLHAVDLAFDENAARALMIQLARALEASRAPAPKKRMPWERAAALYESARAGDDAALRVTAAAQIRVALEQGKLDVNALLAGVLAGDGDSITARAQNAQLDAAMLLTLAQSAIKPALRAWATQLAPLARDVIWHKGYCFVCGAGATLGELQGNDAEKHLRCGQCGADWKFPRLRCLFCGNDDHKSLGYVYPDGAREKMRLELCDNCHGYLKIINAFDPTPAEWLAVQDLATLHLDFIAQERGYARVAIR